MGLSAVSDLFQFPGCFQAVNSVYPVADPGGGGGGHGSPWPCENRS